MISNNSRVCAINTRLIYSKSIWSLTKLKTQMVFSFGDHSPKAICQLGTYYTEYRVLNNANLYCIHTSDLLTNFKHMTRNRTKYSIYKILKYFYAQNKHRNGKRPLG